MKRLFSRFLMCALIGYFPVTACSQNVPDSPQSSESHTYRLVTVVEGLHNAWALAFLPDGDMLVTEREGRLRLIKGGNNLREEPVAGLPAIRAGGQGGLMDVVLHPDFTNNRLIYISYSKPNEDGSEATTAVIRGRFEQDALVDVEEIFEAKAWSRGRGHFGSRLAFDKNGYLFISIGDRQAPPRGDLPGHPAQQLDSHHGTTVRLMDDGTIPKDNPFASVAGALPDIWSYGHRNAQGMVIHPETGVVWQNEHGPQGGDELNLIQPGKNFGWPVVGYGVNYGAGSAIHEASSAPGMEDPVHYWVPSIAASGMEVYTGDAFPNWKGNLFVGGLAGKQLARLVMNGNRVASEETLVSGIARIRDVRQGPDGMLYVVFDESGGPSVVRLEPAD